MNLSSPFLLFKKYYRGGMISLILIPAFCIPLLKEEFYNRDLRVIRFNTPNYSSFKEIFKAEIRFMREANFYTLDIDDLTESSLDSMIQFVTKENQKLPYSDLKEFGVKNVVKIEFHENSNYNEFISVLNLRDKLGMMRSVMHFDEKRFVIVDDYNFGYKNYLDSIHVTL